MPIFLELRLFFYSFWQPSDGLRILGINKNKIRLKRK